MIHYAFYCPRCASFKRTGHTTYTTVVHCVPLSKLAYQYDFDQIEHNFDYSEQVFNPGNPPTCVQCGTGLEIRDSKDCQHLWRTNHYDRGESRTCEACGKRSDPHLVYDED